MTNLIKIVLLLMCLCPALAAQSPARADITPQTLTLKVGETSQIALAVLDQSGAAIANPAFAYEPDDALVTATPGAKCKVSRTGLVTGLAPGTCSISAVVLVPSGGAITATQPLVVTVQPGPSLYLDAVTGRAVILQSPSFLREPIPSSTAANPNQKTRIVVFLGNVDPAATPPVSSLDMIDSAGSKFNLPIEYSAALAGTSNLWQVIGAMPTNVASGEATITATVNGIATNAGKFSVNIPPPAAARPSDESFDMNAIVGEAMTTGAPWAPLNFTVPDGVETDKNYYEQGWTIATFTSSTYGKEFRIARRQGDVLPEAISSELFFEPIWGQHLDVMQVGAWPGRYINTTCTGSVLIKFSSDDRALVSWKKTWPGCAF